MQRSDSEREEERENLSTERHSIIVSRRSMRSPHDSKAVRNLADRGAGPDRIDDERHEARASTHRSLGNPVRLS